MTSAKTLLPRKVIYLHVLGNRMWTSYSAYYIQPQNLLPIQPFSRKYWRTCFTQTREYSDVNIQLKQGDLRIRQPMKAPEFNQVAFIALSFVDRKI